MLLNNLPLNAAPLNSSGSGGNPPGYLAFAQGFLNAVQFGLPVKGAITQVGVATGITPTTIIPLQYHPFTQALPAGGWKVTKLGDPTSAAFTPYPAKQVTSGIGVQVTQFGTATAQGSLVAVATGEAPFVRVGTPTLKLSVRAQGIFDTLFGLPVAGYVAHAHGARTTLLGTPSHRRGQVATSAYRATRWGQAKAERSNTFKAYSIQPVARFAQPTGFSHFNYGAAGFASANLGAPKSVETHHALFISPTVRFGNPLMKRTPLC